MSRDPARIDTVLAEIGRFWRKNPDLRLGQIVVKLCDHSNFADPFYVEEPVLLKAIRAWIGSPPEAPAAPATVVLNRPTPSDSPAIWDLVVADMQARDRFGTEKYGQRLRAHDGRDPLVDAYQEALDLAVYLRKAIFERSGK